VLNTAREVTGIKADKKYDFLIVGSGLSGAVFARSMLDAKKTCLVLEKRPHIGGNIHCETIEGIRVHTYGAHIFHTNDKAVWDFLNRFTAFLPFINSPLANFRGKLYNLPFNMNTFYQLWGVTTAKQAEEIIKKQSAEITGEPKNLEEQAIKSVGRDLYETLIKGYTEKQWGRPCDSLPASIIRRVPVRFTFDNNYFDHRYQGIPEIGYNALAEKLLSGAEILCDTDFLNNKSYWKALAKHVVYTGMIDAYFGFCEGPLAYRSLRFEQKVIDEFNHQGVAVMNFTDRETLFTRRIEHKHFENTPSPRTVVTNEFPAEWSLGQEPYYPINDEENKSLYEAYARLAQNEPDTTFLGRLACYQYIDMDQAVANALLAAQRHFKGQVRA
jgi:UDP-galactopyranose mutase